MLLLKRARIAIETLEIFVPLADRLGMGHLRGEMEDYAFPLRLSRRIQKVTELLKQKSKLNQQYLEKYTARSQKSLPNRVTPTSK